MRMLLLIFMTPLRLFFKSRIAISDAPFHAGDNPAKTACVCKGLLKGKFAFHYLIKLYLGGLLSLALRWLLSGLLMSYVLKHAILNSSLHPCMPRNKVVLLI